MFLRHFPGFASGSRRLVLLTAFVLGVLLLMTACLASGQSVDRSLDQYEGRASFYADEFAGETTASGETFDPRALTAAHPTLPFGSRVRVTRIGGEGKQSVTVRVNDRGPYADDRIIDVSEAAAEQLGMIDEGVVEVRIEVLDVPSDGEVTSSRSGTADGW